MATISETTGDEREDRIAELKRKMQESAKKAKAKQEAEAETESTTAVAEADPEAVETSTETSTETTPEEPAAASPAAESTTTAAPSEPTTPVAESNAAAVAAPATAPSAPTPTAEPATETTAEVDEEEKRAQAQMTRREFLTYAWGAAAGLLAVEAGLASYFFMYPRFRAGEFGGKFFLSEGDVPASDAPPAAEVAGKFWLVNTDEGTRALYMVCTHLGCLYKWESSNNRFECPCHGSKFSKAGHYIEGPAPRSLDTFEVSEENNQLVVDTGKKTVGGPAMESPARAITA